MKAGPIHKIWWSPIQKPEAPLFITMVPGGGGVQYADEYFFNLRGKTLTITFDGPYDGGKTPSAETKKLELEILATFSVFRTPRTSAK